MLKLKASSLYLAQVSTEQSFPSTLVFRWPRLVLNALSTYVPPLSRLHFRASNLQKGNCALLFLI